MEIALGSLILDVIKEIGNIFATAKDKEQNLIALGTFLELYGSVTRLKGYAQRIVVQQEATSSPTVPVGDLLREFFDELGAFGEIFRRANLDAIEVFHPDLAHEIREAYGQEILVSYYFTGPLAAQYNLNVSKLEKIINLYKAEDHDWNPFFSIESRVPGFRPSEEWNTPEVWSNFEMMSDQLESFRKAIGDVIRETWDFKDLATLPKRRRKRGA
jgi:hypothetical protein